MRLRLPGGIVVDDALRPSWPTSVQAIGPTGRRPVPSAVRPHVGVPPVGSQPTGPTPRRPGWVPTGRRCSTSGTTCARPTRRWPSAGWAGSSDGPATGGTPRVRRSCSARPRPRPRLRRPRRGSPSGRGQPDRLPRPGQRAGRGRPGAGRRVRGGGPRGVAGGPGGRPPARWRTTPPSAPRPCATTPTSSSSPPSSSASCATSWGWTRPRGAGPSATGSGSWTPRRSRRRAPPRLVDEIWVGSAFVHDTFAQLGRPVRRVPLPRVDLVASGRTAGRPGSGSGSVHLPVLVRSAVRCDAQEPHRPHRGVHGGVRTRRGPGPGHKDDQRRPGLGRHRAGAHRRRRPPRHPVLGREPRPPGPVGPHPGGRLHGLAAPVRGPGHAPAGGHGARHRGPGHRLLGAGGLPRPGLERGDPVLDGRRRQREPCLSSRRAVGRTGSRRGGPGHEPPRPRPRPRGPPGGRGPRPGRGPPRSRGGRQVGPFPLEHPGEDPS